MGFVASLRSWWRWRTQRNRTHIPGIAELKTLGRVVDRRAPVGIDGDQWLIEDSDGRVVFVPYDSARDLKLGDRVEVAPVFQGTAVGPYFWQVVQRLSDESPRLE